MFQHFLLGMAPGVIVSLVQRQGYICWNRFFSKAFYSLHHLPFKESFEQNRKNTGCRQQSTRCFMPGKINEVDFTTKFSSVKSKAKTTKNNKNKTTNLPIDGFVFYGNKIQNIEYYCFENEFNDDLPMLKTWCNFNTYTRRFGAKLLFLFHSKHYLLCV